MSRSGRADEPQHRQDTATGHGRSNPVNEPAAERAVPQQQADRGRAVDATRHVDAGLDPVRLGDPAPLGNPARQSDPVGPDATAETPSSEIGARPSESAGGAHRAAPPVTAPPVTAPPVTAATVESAGSAERAETAESAGADDSTAPPKPATEPALERRQAEQAAAAPAPKRNRKGKPVMPSWDEVLLGVRGQR